MKIYFRMILPSGVSSAILQRDGHQRACAASADARPLRTIAHE